MPVFVSNARLVAGSFTVNIGNHQWGFVDGKLYLEFSYGTGPFGVLFRKKQAISVRNRQVRFEKIDSVMEELRHLSLLAGTQALSVTFTPDVAVPGVFWIVDWPDNHLIERIIENRQAFTVVLQESSLGA